VTRLNDRGVGAGTGVVRGPNRSLQPNRASLRDTCGLGAGGLRTRLCSSTASSATQDHRGQKPQVRHSASRSASPPSAQRSVLILSRPHHKSHHKKIMRQQWPIERCADSSRFRARAEAQGVLGCRWRRELLRRRLSRSVAPSYGTAAILLALGLLVVMAPDAIPGLTTGNPMSPMDRMGC
jgi:hypothetical protein